MLQADGRIRYLNTAGFAIRRSRADMETAVFDSVALRGEDTLLLARLMQAGELPLFVTDAIVEHSIPLSLLGALRKDFRSAYLERPMYITVAESGVRIHLTTGRGCNCYRLCGKLPDAIRLGGQHGLRSF